MENLCTCPSRSCGLKHLWLCRERWACWKKYQHPLAHLLLCAHGDCEIPWLGKGRVSALFISSYFPARNQRARWPTIWARTLRAAALMVYAFSVMQFAAHFICGEGARNYTLCHYMSCARFNFITGQPCWHLYWHDHTMKNWVPCCIEFAANDGVFESSLPHIYPRRSSMPEEEKSE